MDSTPTVAELLATLSLVSLIIRASVDFRVDVYGWLFTYFLALHPRYFFFHDIHLSVLVHFFKCSSARVDKDTGKAGPQWGTSP